MLQGEKEREFCLTLGGEGDTCLSRLARPVLLTILLDVETNPMLGWFVFIEGHLSSRPFLGIGAISVSGLSRFLKSSIGAKIVMAVTGVLMVLWLVLHMAGNLQMFLGPKAMNAYAYYLKHDIMVGKLLWLFRLGLLTMVVLHIWSAYRVTLNNQNARPMPYVANHHHSASSYASRTMIWSGVIVLAFLIYHLLHFTMGSIQSQHFALQTADGHHDVYRMVILGFQQPMVAWFYILAQVLLAFHLSHGVSSFFQSLGWNNEKYQPLIAQIGPTVSGLLCLGFISVPICVLLGILK